MTTPNTTPSAEEKMLNNILDIFIEGKMVLPTDFPKKIKECLKSYRKEILEEVARKLPDYKVYPEGPHERYAAVYYDALLDLLNSLK